MSLITWTMECFVQCGTEWLINWTKSWNLAASFRRLKFPTDRHRPQLTFFRQEDVVWCYLLTYFWTSDDDCCYLRLESYSIGKHLIGAVSKLRTWLIEYVNLLCRSYANSVKVVRPIEVCHSSDRRRINLLKLRMWFITITVHVARCHWWYADQSVNEMSTNRRMAMNRHIVSFSVNGRLTTVYNWAESAIGTSPNCVPPDWNYGRWHQGSTVGRHHPPTDQILSASSKI
jgi:hypothetical protein